MTCLLLLLNFSSDALADDPDGQDITTEAAPEAEAPADGADEEATAPETEPAEEEAALETTAPPEEEPPEDEAPEVMETANEPAEEAVEDETVEDEAVEEDKEPPPPPIVWNHGVVARERAPRYAGVSLALSLTGTIGSGLLAIAPTAGWLPEPAFYVGMAGMMFGPSLGQFYCREYDRVYFTSSLRILSAGVGVGGALLDQTNPAGDLGVITPPDTAGKWMMLSSGMLIGGIALYDVIDSPASARRVSPPAVSLTPTGAALTWDW